MFNLTTLLTIFFPKILRTIRDQLAISSGMNNEEWIELGIFDCLFRMLCEREKTFQEMVDIIVKIIDLLQLHIGSHFQHFCDAFHEHIYTFENCTMLLYMLHTLILRHPNSSSYSKVSEINFSTLTFA